MKSLLFRRWFLAFGALALSATLARPVAAYEGRLEDPKKVGDGDDSLVEQAQGKHSRSRTGRVINEQGIEERGPLFTPKAIYVNPSFGGEVLGMSAPLHQATPEYRGMFAGGYTASIAAGWRTGAFSFGGRYQRTNFPAVGFSGMGMNKLYGEFGLNYTRGIVLAQAYLDFGWASVSSANAFWNGLGGKLGGQLDFYITRWLSVGPSTALDLQAFNITSEQRWVSTIGGTFLAHVGVRI